MDSRLQVRALTRRRPARGRQQSGFTLLELMVSVAIFTVITGAIYGLLRVGTSDRFTTNQRAELLQNARIALNAVSRDALNAGFEFPDEGAVTGPGSLVTFGLPDDPLQATDILLPVIARDGANTNSLNPTAGVLTDQVTFTYTDDSFNPDADGNPEPLTIDNVFGPSNRIVNILNPPAPIPTQTGDVYILSGSPPSVLAYCTIGIGPVLLFGSFGDPLSINARAGFANLLATNASRLRRVRCVSYFVDPDGTLMRRTLGDPDGAAGFLSMPLADGVEDLQIEYVLQDGTVVTSPTPAETGTIRQLRVVMQIRSPEMDQRSREFFRTTLASTVNTRNITYRR